MACSASACQSGCWKEDSEHEKVASPAIEKNREPKTDDDVHHNLCSKCKTDEAITGDDGCICLACFRSSLFGKFKVAVNSHGMIFPTDNVLVAFSGGASSRVALQFVHEVQIKAQRNFDASRDKSLSVFGVGVAFIDESALSPISSQEFEKAIQEIRSIVSSLAPPAKELHITPIESICSLEPNDGKNRLEELLHLISDVTGKEDLLQHLRMMSLQKIAFDNGYNKLVLGSCTSRIACHVLSATVKGQGYSLPADMQYVDARWEIPVVLPLRDCIKRELNMLCRLDSLKTLELLDGPCTGINGLVSSFVALLQEENPSRERTIVRTAEKLSPFHFNQLPITDDLNDHLPSRRLLKKLNLKFNESIPSEVFCPICNSPLNKSELQSLRNSIGSCQSGADIFGVSCCSSCQFQIIPKEHSSMDQLYSLLPQRMITRAKVELVGNCDNQSWLREQIKDCLLSDDDENGT